MVQREVMHLQHTHAHAYTHKVSACKTADKGVDSPLLLRVKPPLTALAAAFQLLSLSSVMPLRFPLVAELECLVELVLLVLVFLRLVSSPSCVLISWSLSLMEELCLASERAVGLASAYNIISDWLRPSRRHKLRSLEMPVLSFQQRQSQSMTCSAGLQVLQHMAASLLSLHQVYACRDCTHMQVLSAVPRDVLKMSSSLSMRI